jgi:hypothetical protein
MTETDPICLWTETARDTPTDHGLIEKFIRGNDIALVIIDTFATYLMVKDETDNSEVTRKLTPYVDMAHSTGTTILFVHHERKNREDSGDDTRAIRGGGAILALADVAFQLKPDGGGTRRRLKSVGRFQEVPPTLQLDYRNDEYVSLGTPDEATRAEKRAKVVAVLPATEPGLTVAEVATKAGLGEKAARTALEDAFGRDPIARKGAGRKGDPHRYLRAPESQIAELIAVISDDRVREVTEV